MASITVEKRTRALATDSWGNWTTVVVAPPYVDTALVEYRIQSTASAILELTNGEIVIDADDKYVWQGTGIFDKMIEAVSANIKTQFDNGAIPESDRATVYLGALQYTISEAVKILLQQKTAEKQLDVLEEQRLLYRRQRAGFDDNKYQKILEAKMNAWGITFQDTDTTFVPAQLNQAGFDESFTAAKEDYFE